MSHVLCPLSGCVRTRQDAYHFLDPNVTLLYSVLAGKTSEVFDNDPFFLQALDWHRRLGLHVWYEQTAREWTRKYAMG